MLITPFSSKIKCTSRSPGVSPVLFVLNPLLVNWTQLVLIERSYFPLTPKGSKANPPLEHGNKLTQYVSDSHEKLKLFSVEVCSRVGQLKRYEGFRILVITFSCEDVVVTFPTPVVHKSPLFISHRGRGSPFPVCTWSRRVRSGLVLF